MEDKIMAGGNLQDILNRLTYCHELMRSVAEDQKSDAMRGCADLLRSIVGDLETDVDFADDAPTTKSKELNP